MPLINVIITLIAVGLILWVINNYLPMDRKIKSSLNAVVVIVVVGWLFQLFGITDQLRHFRVGK